MKLEQPERHLSSVSAQPPVATSPAVVFRSAPGGLGAVLAALDELRTLEDTDVIFKRAIELARDRIGLRRAGLFVFDRLRNLMLGTWGMDLSGSVVDEHHVIYELTGTDAEALRRSETHGAPFTVFENCPIIEHQGFEMRVGGRGWVAKTPIRSAHGPIGMLFNDGALTGEPVDDIKQAHAAILCSVLGAMLDPMRSWIARRTAAEGESVSHRLVASTVALLKRNPALGGKEVAATLKIGLARLCRVFKVLMGVSLVDYRNRLRLDRFQQLVDEGCTNLRDAARDAGFGSYSQFHRVFRTRLRMTPSAYLFK
jgi:AraC-like DNA-binding protein